MRQEQGISARTMGDISKVDLSIDPQLMAKARRLMVREVTREQAKSWIKGRAKERWERAVVGKLGKWLGLPVVAIGAGGVILADGSPAFYNIQVGFIGKGNTVVNGTEYTKLRTLKSGIQSIHEQPPFSTTLFVGGRHHDRDEVDERVHSGWGAFLRKSGGDEFPQFWAIEQGRVAAVSLRGYFPSEQRGLILLFDAHDQTGCVLPKEFPKDYREVVSDVEPKPGFAGLYSATLKKNLTPTERLALDHMYLTGANFAADVVLLVATLRTTMTGVGSR